MLIGCNNSKFDDGRYLAHKRINCATAEADIRSLNHEKAHLQDQIKAGVSSLTPIGLVVGLVTHTEGEKLQVTTGDYNKMLDQKIAEIKKHCGIK